MVELVSNCGLDCHACPWGPYPRKNMTAPEFEEYRNKAKYILGYMPIKTPCVTCQTPDDQIPSGAKLPNRKCLIRQCVEKTKIENCAYCSRFPCDTLQATAGIWNRKSIEDKRGLLLSEQDYHVFVVPFEGINRLGAIRASLSQEVIVEPAKISTPNKVVTFPDKLSFSAKETAAFKAVHVLLTALQRSSLGMQNADTFSQHHRLESRKAHVFRFLWIIGRYGEFEDRKKAHLALDPRTFLANRGSEKSLAIWSFLKDIVFSALSEFGIFCELIALEGVKEKDLTTGTGYLRYTGWFVRMSFNENTGGSAALKALQKYTQRLDEKYSKKAFQLFRDADLRVLAAP